MAEDAYWYEAAFVAGITTALNVAADGLITPGGPLIEPVNENLANENTKKLFAEIPVGTLVTVK